MTTVALIPARGGSKGIPGKNIKPIGGRPLIHWTCCAAAQCARIDAVYVATDDPAIAKTAEAIGLEKVRAIGRGPETATDTASTESVLLDFAERAAFDRIVLVQATSPLLRAEDLEAGFALLEAGFDSVLSCVRQTRFRWRRGADGAAAPENYDPRARPRRQEFAGDLVENGAFYITSRARLLEDRCRIGGRIGLVEMPEETYAELDDAADWRVVEALLEHRGRGGSLAARLRRVRLAATDVDGCLTDSGMYYGRQGEALKKFNTRDGKAFALLRAAGLHTAIVTAEATPIALRRGEKVGAGEVHLDAADKVAVFEGMLARHGLTWDEAAYLGDDLGDLEVLRRVGVAACPADAVPAVRRVCHAVLDLEGGRGAFRALAELILEAQRG